LSRKFGSTKFEPKRRHTTPTSPDKKIPVANESTIATCPFGAESIQAFGKKTQFLSNNFSTQKIKN